MDLDKDSPSETRKEQKRKLLRFARDVVYVAIFLALGWFLLQDTFDRGKVKHWKKLHNSVNQSE